jgi:16S rRNA (guanine(527)-N(7))-methyltransferase RsmG
MEFSEMLAQYVDILMDYNRKVNLVSRKMTRENLDQLLEESLLLNRYIPVDVPLLADAGSGNGIMGIPIALSNKNRKVVLVEPKKKKVVFLCEVKKRMGLTNVDVRETSIEEYLNGPGKKARILIARGFPGLEVFVKYVQQGKIDEAVLITSDNKIKKNQIHLESVTKKTYNVPLRKNLKILKMEKSAGDKNKKK